VAKKNKQEDAIGVIESLIDVAQGAALDEEVPLA